MKNPLNASLVILSFKGNLVILLYKKKWKELKAPGYQFMFFFLRVVKLFYCAKKI